MLIQINLNYSKMKQAVCALIYKGTQVLLVSRKDNHLDFGLPGGKVDEGETPEKALCREVEEETGLKVKVNNLLFEEVDDNGYHVKTYECSLIDHTAEIKTSEAGLVKWGAITEIVTEHCSFKDYNFRLILQLTREAVNTINNEN